LSWLEATLPTGADVACHVRWSSNNGLSYGDWLEVQNGAPLPGPTAAYLQIRLTLTAPPDHQATPVVSTLTVIVGELHRWTSPAINITDTTGPKLVSMVLVGLRATVEVKLDSAPWQTATNLIETGSANTMQVRATLIRTATGDAYLSSLSVFEALLLRILDDQPRLEVQPPAVTHVTCYVEDSEPLIEASAALPGVPDDKRVEVRISVPAGSSLAYAQQVADAFLAQQGRERISLVCRVPLVTRLRFDELVAVSLPYIGYTKTNPWLARVQRMVHRPLADVPHTELTLGDFLPDDVEAQIRLLRKE